MARVALRHDYDAPARAVWEICTDLDALAEVCAPLLRFEGLPSGRIHAGQAIEVGVRLFGVLPPQRYHMEVAALDDSAMTFQSREQGAGVRRWDHALRVVTRGARAGIEEESEIEAGPATPLMAAWARLLYRHRHAGRLGRLARQEQSWRP
jgi:ligand-binding SRPBCC domain-containing protein